MGSGEINEQRNASRLPICTNVPEPAALQASQAALQLFAFGQEQAAVRGLLLVDTKYEFGNREDGSIMLVDEIHTPDSSRCSPSPGTPFSSRSGIWCSIERAATRRYWLAESYADRLAQGKEPHNIDKEFLRLWFRQHCDPYHDKVGSLKRGGGRSLIEFSCILQSYNHCAFAARWQAGWCWAGSSRSSVGTGGRISQ